MIIRCPSCAGGFEMSEEAIGVKATTLCPLCGRIVVVRDARVAPPGAKESTVPFDPGTEAEVEPVNPLEERTAIASKGAHLSLPADRRVALAVLSGPRKGDVVVLKQPRMVVGRLGAGADIPIDDPEMSRSHAAIECRGVRILLVDLGSRNGTFVGEEKVATRELEDRSEFRLASTRFMLMLTRHE